MQSTAEAEAFATRAEARPRLREARTAVQPKDDLVTRIGRNSGSHTEAAEANVQNRPRYYAADKRSLLSAKRRKHGHLQT
eukprot:6096349-Pleurochrysis_carterae.AAC.1